MNAYIWTDEHFALVERMERMMNQRERNYVWWASDDEPTGDDVNIREFRDSEGNILTMKYTTEDEMPIPEGAAAFLEEWGYSGPGDWKLA